jgi:hypothetical protein
MSQGDTAAEALANIQEVLPLWLEGAIESGFDIPELRHEEDYSGKFVVRVPRSLHRELVQGAQEEGVSLNQLVNTLLARALGQSLGTAPLRGVLKDGRRSRPPPSPAFGPPTGLAEFPSASSHASTVLHEASAPFETQPKPGRNPDTLQEARPGTSGVTPDG